MKIKDPKHPMTPGSSLMTCPSSTRRCIQILTHLAQPVTSRKVWMTPMNRVVDGWRDSRQLGKTATGAGRASPPTCSS